VLTATFQWGWGLSLIGLPSPYGTVPIASYVPLMMFAALFGLSMDYEVFLVSQIAQHHAAGEEPRQAVRSGVTAAAKVIAAAAVIMIAVFGSFIINADPTIKQFGVGLSVAVLLAGTMVLLLAPALLVLFGRWTWALPPWLARVVPHVDVEGESALREPAGPPPVTAPGSTPHAEHAPPGDSLDALRGGDGPPGPAARERDGP
jgi:RND superfamily putative drug exporter